MAQPSNFKGQVFAPGGECRKFVLWLKRCLHVVFFILLLVLALEKEQIINITLEILNNCKNYK